MEHDALTKIISKEDAICLLELIHSSLSCTKEEEFRKLIGKLNCLIPFDFAVCGLAQADPDGRVKSYETVNISYPIEWLNIYLTRKYHQVDPIFKCNFKNFGLQYWSDTYKRITPPVKFMSDAESFALRKGYTYGVKNLKGTEGSLFSISGMSIECHPCIDVMLTLIIPHLHQALCRILCHNNRKQSCPISSREREVLQWIRQGKSSWDISAILDISERTVNFHVNNIMQKLDVVNRLQAVAVAIDLGELDIE